MFVFIVSIYFIRFFFFTESICINSAPNPLSFNPIELLGFSNYRIEIILLLVIYEKGRVFLNVEKAESREKKELNEGNS